jgi:hypothetical protein
MASVIDHQIDLKSRCDGAKSSVSLANRLQTGHSDLAKLDPPNATTSTLAICIDRVRALTAFCDALFTAPAHDRTNTERYVMNIGAISTTPISYQVPQVAQTRAVQERTESSAAGRPDGDGDGDDAVAASTQSTNKVDLKV